MSEQDDQQQEPERFVDPNSGAAPQPGGMVSPGLSMEGSGSGDNATDNSPNDAAVQNQAMDPDAVPKASDQTDQDSDLGSNVDDVDEPGGNASQAEWAQYAVDHKGADKDEASEMSRNDLRDTYGSK